MPDGHGGMRGQCATYEALLEGW